MDSYAVAKKHGMLDASEIDLIKACVASLPPNPIIVNIGAGAGTSCIAMLEERPKAFIFSLDVQPRKLEQVNAEMCNVNHERIVRVLGNSSSIGLFFPYNDVDLVFVDGGHSNRQVFADTITWLPHIKTGGFMLFHDYKHPNVPGLTKVVDKAMVNYRVVGEARYLIAYKIGQREQENDILAEHK